MNETEDDSDNVRSQDENENDDDNKNHEDDENDNDHGRVHDDDGKHGGRSRRTLLSEEQLIELVSSLNSGSGSAGDANTGEEASTVVAATAGGGENEELQKENQRLQTQSSPPSTTASADNHPSLLQAQSAPGAYYVHGGIPEALVPPPPPSRTSTTPRAQPHQHNSQLGPHSEERSDSHVEQCVNSQGNNVDISIRDRSDDSDSASTTDTSVLATVPPRYWVATGMPANWPHQVTVATSPRTTAAAATTTATANSDLLSSSVVSQLTDAVLNSLIPADSTPDDDAVINDRNANHQNGNNRHQRQHLPPTTTHLAVDPLHASLVEARKVETDERLETRVAAEIQARLQAEFQEQVEQEVQRKLRNIAQAHVVVGGGGESIDVIEEGPVGEGPVSFSAISRTSRPSRVASTTTSGEMSSNSLSQRGDITNENMGEWTNQVYAMISNAFCWNEESNNAETTMLCCGHKKKAAICVTALVLVLIAIAVGVGVFIAKDNSGSNVPESEKYLELKQVLLQVTDATVLNNPDTPQNQALQWLAYDDQLHLDPNSNSSAAYEIIQRYAATVLYYATRGQRWENQCNFLNTTMSICKWNDVEKKRGLFCHEENDDLFSIDLQKNLLISGPLPPEIGYLTSLKFLSLSQNFIAGSIPSSLGLLTQLIDLELDGNYLTGTLPPELGRMTNMEFLYAFNNNLEGSLPDSLFLLSKLKILWLRDNRFSGSLPTFRLPGMNYFDMNTNRLTGTLPLSICDMLNLTTFFMYSNDLKGDIPSCLGELTNLSEFLFSITFVSISLDINRLTFVLCATPCYCTGGDRNSQS